MGNNSVEALLCKEVGEIMPKLTRKTETCESCGRDLPESEICQYCGYNNHQIALGGWACKRIKNEIEAERRRIEQ